ncbi:MAG: nucleotidyl transferase AbiEii/AbiGii toxin family protein [Candidatus Rokubacteria bacterium]|nr:nucleotidyl transferase AbiEii/AbiGii toxin family protein [Candidatus Rokubacteria bacterium]
MTRTQRRDVVASVRDRLLNLARERGEDFQLILTRYAVERLLYRLSVSRYRDQFLLKGAMLFLVWTGHLYRPTRDLDLLGRGENEVAQVEEVFQTVCAVPVEDDGLQFLGETIRGERIREEDEYEGVRLRFAARLAEARIPVQVDIAFGDAVRPAPEEADFPTILPFPAPRLQIYPREAVVAEKFQIMVSLGIANSRMKDFADVWTLARVHPFEGRALAEAIGATFVRRRTPLPGTAPLALTAEFSEDHGKRAQWDAFVRRGRLRVDGQTLGDVVTLLRAFLMPPALAVGAGKPFNKRWPAGGPWRAGRANRR